MTNLKTILSKYSVTIVMVPTIIGLHYGWNMIQNNRTLVTEEERIDLPPVTLAKYLWHSVIGNKVEDDNKKLKAASK